MGCASTSKLETEMQDRLAVAVSRLYEITNNFDDEQSRAYLVYLDALSKGDSLATFDASVAARDIIPDWPAVIQSINEIRSCVMTLSEIEAQKQANKRAWRSGFRGAARGINDSIMLDAQLQQQTPSTVMYPQQNQSTEWQERRARQEYFNNLNRQFGVD